MVAVDRSFPNGSPVCDYWLSRCEGFTVRAGSRNLGVVEQLGSAAAGRVQTLVVRKRHRRQRAIATGHVLAVVPARQLLLARRAQHVAPAARVVGAAAKTTAALLRAFAAVLWAFLVRGAVELRLGDEPGRYARPVTDRDRERDVPDLQWLEELARRLPRGRQWPALLGAHEVWGTEVSGEQEPRRISSESGAAGRSGRSSGRTGVRAP